MQFRLDPDVEDKKEEESGPKTIDVGKEAAIEAEVQAARQRAVVPLEIRMKQFRDMLSEKDVSPPDKHAHTHTQTGLYIESYPIIFVSI